MLGYLRVKSFSFEDKTHVVITTSSRYKCPLQWHLLIRKESMLPILIFTFSLFLGFESKKNVPFFTEALIYKYDFKVVNGLSKFKFRLNLFQQVYLLF